MSISCDEALELISARLDGMLEPAEAQLLDAHLAQCPSCQLLQSDLTAISGVMGSMEAEPPADLTESVLREIRAGKVVPLKSAHRWGRWAAAAAVFALVLAGAFHGLPPQQAPEEAQPLAVTAFRTLPEYTLTDQEEEALARLLDYLAWTQPVREGSDTVRFGGAVLTFTGDSEDGRCALFLLQQEGEGQAVSYQVPFDGGKICCEDPRP